MTNPNLNAKFKIFRPPCRAPEAAQLVKFTNQESRESDTITRYEQRAGYTPHTTLNGNRVPKYIEKKRPNAFSVAKAMHRTKSMTDPRTV